mmetsp:Transcript_19535/g.74979  ORF Transcript_19535/g.74979 Transcript_19535/m.74979 type:complete len:272 (-) Transcript_19535:2310-3125(-)
MGDGGRRELEEEGAHGHARHHDAGHVRRVVDDVHGGEGHLLGAADARTRQEEGSDVHGPGGARRPSLGEVGEAEEGNVLLGRRGLEGEHLHALLELFTVRQSEGRHRAAGGRPLIERRMKGLQGVLKLRLKAARERRRRPRVKGSLRGARRLEDEEEAFLEAGVVGHLLAHSPAVVLHGAPVQHHLEDVLLHAAHAHSLSAEESEESALSRHRHCRRDGVEVCLDRHLRIPVPLDHVQPVAVSEVGSASAKSSPDLRNELEVVVHPVRDVK